MHATHVSGFSPVNKVFTSASREKPTVKSKTSQAASQASTFGLSCILITADSANWNVRFERFKYTVHRTEL